MRFKAESCDHVRSRNVIFFFQHGTYNFMSSDARSSRLNETNLEPCTWNIFTNSIYSPSSYQTFLTFECSEKFSNHLILGGLPICGLNARLKPHAYTWIAFSFCGALQRIVMFMKAFSIRKQELTQMGKMYSWWNINLSVYFHRVGRSPAFVVPVIISEVVSEHHESCYNYLRAEEW